MKAEDRRGYVERYEARLEHYGASSQALGWGEPGREHVRFAVMAEPVLELDSASVLDVGCGFADLYDYLRARGWRGTYTGVDLVPGLLAVARDRHPELDLREGDIAEADVGGPRSFDVVAASGIFNWQLEEEANLDHIERSLRRMFELARFAVVVDFLSANVDFRREGAWHTDPAWAVGLAARLSRRFRLRNDYMAFEFAIVSYRDDSHERGVFVGDP